MFRRILGFEVAAVLATLLVSGCFSYVPVEPGAASVGDDVRVILTREGMESLRALDQDGGGGSSAGPFVEGTLVRRSGDEVLVRIATGVRRVGFHQTQLGRDVRISRQEIVQLERRELDRVGTGLLAAGAAAGAGAIVYMILSDARQPQGTEHPTEVELRAPFVSLPFLSGFE